MVNTKITLVLFFAARRWRSSIAKVRLKLKKVGKTTRPFRYDLNQIPYDWLYSGSDRFKGFDLIDRVPGELWTEVCNIVQEALIKTIPKKKKRKMPKMVVWGGLINSRERKRSKRQRKGKIYPNECRVPEKSKERWESLPKWTVQRNRAKPLKWERLEISSRKLEIPREHYMQRWAQ